MIISYQYKSEKITKIPLDKINSRSWTRIIEPTKEDTEIISKNTGITAEELNETREEDERPKITKNKYLEIIYRAPYVENGEITTVPVYIYLLKDMIITIEKRELKILKDLSYDMNHNKKKFLFKKGFPYFIFYLLDSINDRFLVNIDKIAANIDFYEEVSKKTLTTKDIERIYEQSVTLSFFNQALIANIEVLNNMRKGFYKEFTSTDKHLFEELYYDALQILDTEKIQREAMANLFNLQSVITSTRLNFFMKKLAAIALVIAVPTLISGIYGMNFKYLPLKDHPYGFYIISSIMIITSILLYVYFTKRE